MMEHVPPINTMLSASSNRLSGGLYFTCYIYHLIIVTFDKESRINEGTEFPSSSPSNKSSAALW